MKKNALNLIVILLSIMAVMSSCEQDTYPPSLSLDLEPYIIYYQEVKYELYDAEGNKKINDENLEKVLRAEGAIQSYIDLNHESKLKYSVDDNGEFWSAEYLNSIYEYPTYSVSSLGEDEATVKVAFDPEIGIQTADGGIDLGLATSVDNPFYTFTYTATAGSETTVKKVHLRVYNSYSNLAGLYLSRLSLVNVTANVGSLWVDAKTIDDTLAFGYGYGDAKVVRFTVDGSIDLKMKLNRLVNNNKIKGTIKGETDTIPTDCIIGAKKGDNTIVELEVTGAVIENDPYVNEFGVDEQASVKSLIVLSNRFVGQNTTGRIKSISVNDGEGNKIDVPLICIEYSVKRYKLIPDESTEWDYLYNGKKWDDLDTQFRRWSNTFRETFVKQVYWTAANKAIINSESNHYVSVN